MLRKQRRASELILVSIDRVRRRKLSARQASTAWVVTLLLKDRQSVKNVHLVGSKRSRDRTTARLQKRVPSLVVMGRLKLASQVDGMLPSATRTVSAWIQRRAPLEPLERIHRLTFARRVLLDSTRSKGLSAVWNARRENSPQHQARPSASRVTKVKESTRTRHSSPSARFASREKSPP